MRISDHSGSYLTIRQIGCDSAQNVHAKVRAVGYGFSGSNKSVWFARDSIDQFVIDLRNLEQTRHGVAVLATMSPTECQIQIQNSDSLGNLTLDVLISRYLYSGRKNDQLYCHIKLGIDATTFPNTVDRLTKELAPSSN